MEKITIFLVTLVWVHVLACAVVMFAVNIEVSVNCTNISGYFQSR